VLLLAARPYIRVWYLFALAAYVALARALRSVPTAVIVPVAAVLSVAAYAVWPPDGWAQGADSWLTIPQHWVFFVCAERGARQYRALADRTRPLLAIGVCALFASSGLLLWRLGLLEGASHPRSAVPALLMSMLGTIVTVTTFPVVGRWWALGWARAMGRYSLGIYATHYVTGIAVVFAVVPHLEAIRGPGMGVVVPFAVVVVVAVASYWFTRAIDRWAPVPLLRPWWSTTARAGERSGAAAPAQ
jgi:peptidoglycan/LPS O-acetylase OafA/YrhL